MRLDLAETTLFHDKLLPGQAKLVGWAALVQALSVQAPVRRPSAVSEKHVRGSHREEEGWQIFNIGADVIGLGSYYRQCVELFESQVPAAKPLQGVYQ